MFFRRARTFTTVILLGTLSCGILPSFAQVRSETLSGVDQAIPVANFDPNFVLDDSDLFDLGGLTLADVQTFLSEKGSLGSYRTKDIDGNEKSAAEIIWRVSTSYQINPKYLMALMQKEQSLIEDSRPKQKQFDWATGYGVCDSCSKDDPRIQDFKGFANQLEWAAKQHREKYLLQILGKGATIAGNAPGKTVIIDGKRITPVNNATAMLYSYTPHIHGNVNLWNIWQRWYALSFPEGTMVRGSTSKQLYLLRYGQKKPIASLAVASSLMDASKIITVEDSKLSAYRLGDKIRFPNYSLVSTGTQRYLLVGTQKRLISPAAFTKFGFVEDEIIEASGEELAYYSDGPDITTITTYPIGLLVKDPKGAYWYIENAVRHPVPDRLFVNLYFKNRTVRSWTQKQLENVTLGIPYRLQDGELVRSKEEAAVFVIEEGKRRAFLSGADFEELGYSWKNVITLPAALLANYELGMPIFPHNNIPILTEEDSIPMPLPLAQATSTVAAATFGASSIIK